MERSYELVQREALSDMGWHLHMEWMRAVIRKALADGKRISDVAAEMGVDVGKVRTFLLGRHLFESTVEPFASWCVGRDHQPYHMEQAALAVLAADHPQLARPWVRRCMARTMKHAYISRNDRVPEWVTDELAAWDQLKPRQNNQGAGRP